MNIAHFIVTYILTAIFFLVIDLTWLGIIARKYYLAQLGHLFREQVNWTAAGLFYSLYIVGMIVFAIQPGVDNASLVRTVILGLFYGFITYATYDLTNLATLKDWPLAIAVVDIAWGTVLGGLVSTFGYFVATRLP
jgi:uncharacterized membrane protein